MSRISILVLALSLSGGYAAADSGTYNLEFGPTPLAHTADPSESPPVPAAIADQSLAWKPCGETGLQDLLDGEVAAAARTALLDGLQCASVQTPLDWSDPAAGPTVSFEISRLPGRGMGRPLLTSPGGPGAGTLLNPIQWATAIPELRDSYDLIGFDPRGTSLSSTAADCDVNSSGDPQLLATGRNDGADILDFSPASVHRQLSQAKAWIQSCVQRSARTPTGRTVLGAVDYWQTVRDLDLVRSLLGAPTWSYLGASQGTALGLELARTFPGNIDRLVLDSIIDPARSLADAHRDRVLHQQRTIEDAFAPWLATRGTPFGDSREAVLAALTRMRADLTAHPLALPLDRTFSGNDLNTVLFGVGNGPYEALERKLLTLHAAMYSPSPAAQLNAAVTFRLPPLTDELNGDLVRAGSRVGWWTARNCNDAGWSHDLDEIVTTAQQVAAQAPLTYLGMGFTAACAFWPEPHHDPNSAPLDHITSALLISNEKDPVTPISGARAAHAAIPNSRLITVPGTQHHLVLPQTLPNGLPGSIPTTSTCATSAVIEYLMHGQLPDTDTTCRPDR
ncbi:alpha/beta fold hydrolase [Nocardia sp. NPDC050710]|uniref:alpha/beta fold hydrolase n=1 Tax=Nocardia sp. NPDC050710 TaxID=3157220 RepID=UPI0033FCBA03